MSVNYGCESGAVSVVSLLNYAANVAAAQESANAKIEQIKQQKYQQMVAYKARQAEVNSAYRELLAIFAELMGLPNADAALKWIQKNSGMTPSYEDLEGLVLVTAILYGVNKSMEMERLRKKTSNQTARSSPFPTDPYAHLPQSGGSTNVNGNEFAEMTQAQRAAFASNMIAKALKSLSDISSGKQVVNISLGGGTSAYFKVDATASLGSNNPSMELALQNNKMMLESLAISVNIGSFRLESNTDYEIKYAMSKDFSGNAAEISLVFNTVSNTIALEYSAVTNISKGSVKSTIGISQSMATSSVPPSSNSFQMPTIEPPSQEVLTVVAAALAILVGVGVAVASGGAIQLPVAGY